MRKITKRSAAITAATVIALGGGAAWAAANWFSGSGTATASASSVQNVTAIGTVSDKLWPGRKLNAAVSITNPNDYPVRVTGATISSLGVANAEGGCTLAEAKLSLGNVPNGVVVNGKPAASSTVTPVDFTFPEFIRMATDASPACANATFTVSLTLEGAVA
jgi:hypothetical protein